MTEFFLHRGPESAEDALNQARNSSRFAPLRAPHHTASVQAIVGYAQSTGAGIRYTPGEIGLAANGTLLLQDLPEFGRETVEAIGRALHTGRESLEFTVRPGVGLIVTGLPRLVIASAQPCPCGFHGTRGVCSCGTAMLTRWNQRIRRAWALIEKGANR